MRLRAETFVQDIGSNTILTIITPILTLFTLHIHIIVIVYFPLLGSKTMTFILILVSLIVTSTSARYRTEIAVCIVCMY